MARESNFVADFRASVAAMLSTFQATLALVDKADALGWDETSFLASLPSGSDITPTEFYAAVNAVRTLRSENATATLALVKLVT
jgi:hypothetical protein